MRVSGSTAAVGSCQRCTRQWPRLTPVDEVEGPQLAPADRLQVVRLRCRVLRVVVADAVLDLVDADARLHTIATTTHHTAQHTATAAAAATTAQRWRRAEGRQAVRAAVARRLPAATHPPAGALARDAAEGARRRVCAAGHVRLGAGVREEYLKGAVGDAAGRRQPEQRATTQVRGRGGVGTAPQRAMGCVRMLPARRTR